MSMLEQACITANEKFLMSIPDTLPEPVYSKKHIRKINKLKNKMRNDRYHHLTTGTVKVMLVAAIILSLMVSSFAIPTTREYIIEQFKKYSVFQATATDDSQNVDGITLGYIPEGFEVVREYSDGWQCSVKYSNNNDWFMIRKTMIKTGVGFDTEEYDCQTSTLNGREYIIYTNSPGNNGIIFDQGNYIFKLSGNISEEEMLKIAQNIK